VPQRRANRAHGLSLAGTAPRFALRAASMPSLLRFLTVIGIIFGIGYAVIYSLATFIDPKPREITVTVPPDKFVKQQH
jgi:hypothetical protein